MEAKIDSKEKQQKDKKVIKKKKEHKDKKAEIHNQVKKRQKKTFWQIENYRIFHLIHR